MERYEDPLFTSSLQSLTYLSLIQEGLSDFSLLKSSQFNIEHKEDNHSCELLAARPKQQHRTPFQSIGNCQQLNEQQILHFPHFGKTSSLSSTKPSLKDKSQLLKENQPISLMDGPYQLTQQPKRQNILLAQDLENKMKQLDVKLSAKIKMIKQQFWQNRSKSLHASQNRTISRSKQVKSRLIDHLNKKPSNQSHENLKDCYLKFIPMREILTIQGVPIQNPKIVQSKFLAYFQAQLKS